MINVRWKSEVDLQSSWLNFTIVAVDEHGGVHNGFLFISRSTMDSRKEREFSINLGLLQPFHSYTVNVKGTKRIYDDYVESEKSNEIMVRTMEEGMQVFNIPLSLCMIVYCRSSPLFSPLLFQAPSPLGHLKSLIFSINPPPLFSSISEAI